MALLGLKAILGGAVVLGGAAFVVVQPRLSPSSPPLCRVEAQYQPVPWPKWAKPEDRLRRITVALRPGCPENGVARVVFRNSYGRTLPETGYYTLTAVFPAVNLPGGLEVSGVWPTWQAYWISASRKEYRVEQQKTP